MAITYQHPECVVVGLEFAQTRAILHWAIHTVQQGARLTDGQIIRGWLDNNVPLRVRAIPAHALAEWLPYAAIHDGRALTAYQILWPDQRGRWPDDPGFEIRFAWQQPLLGADVFPRGGQQHV